MRAETSWDLLPHSVLSRENTDAPLAGLGGSPPGRTEGVHYCRSAGPVMVSLTTGLLRHLPASDPSGRRGAAADGSHLRDLWGYGPVAVVGVPSLRL